MRCPITLLLYKIDPNSVKCSDYNFYKDKCIAIEILLPGLSKRRHLYFNEISLAN